MTEYQGIIERVRAATGADRELDEALRIHFGYPPKPWNYTISIDAALALAERVLPGHMGGFEPGLGGICHGKVVAVSKQMTQLVSSARAPTAPLAIILATLLALQSQEPK